MSEYKKTGGDVIWIHIVMKTGANLTVHVDTYLEFSEESHGSYTDDNWREEVEWICQDRYDGWQYQRFTYDFEIVPRPPDEWLQKQVETMTIDVQSTMRRIEKLRELIGT